MRIAALLPIFVAFFTLTPPSPAQQPKPSDPTPRTIIESDALRSAWQDAHAAKKYARAAEILQQLLKRPDATPVDRYNLACILAKLGKKQDAEAALRDAIGAGFADFALMVQDPDLASLRDTDTYKAVLEGWAELQDAVIDGRIKSIEADAPGKYRVARLADLRIAMVSAASQRGVDEAQAEIKNAARLWDLWLDPPAIKSASKPGDAKPAKELAARPAPWVLVWLPDDADFKEWSRQTFGPKATNIGGLYTHHNLQLVARDLGPTLRHEFWHVLHYRDMSRRNQQHPLWIQEGLCSLIEDITEEPEADKQAPALSWRTNMARRMTETGGLPKLADLMGMPAAKFMGSGSLGRYGASRAFFVYLSQHGKLKAWYADYVTTFADDPTGKATTARILGKPLDKIDREFRVWLRSLPAVGEAGLEIVTLPFDVDQGSGEGVLVLDLPLDQQLKHGVTPGEIIVAVNGKTIRDRHDLAVALARKQPGDEVKLTIRSRGKDREQTFKLLPKQ